MEDYFYESNVKRDQGKIGVLFPVFSIIALIIFIVFLNTIPILLGFNIIYFTGMISFGLCYLLYRMIKNLHNVEYQIEITNDMFEAARVTNQKKLEVLADFSLKDTEFIGPVTSDRFRDDISNSDFNLNCTSKREYEIKDDIWYIKVVQDRNVYNLIFEFEPEMYQVFRRYNPRGTKPYVVRT